MMKAVHIPLIMLGGLLLVQSGCVHVSKYSMVRFWADWNSYGTPAFFTEREDHLPPYNPRVEYYRWMYGMGPGETPAVIHYRTLQQAAFTPQIIDPVPKTGMPPAGPSLPLQIPEIPTPADEALDEPENSLSPLPPIPAAEEDKNLGTDDATGKAVSFERPAKNRSPRRRSVNPSQWRRMFE